MGSNRAGVKAKAREKRRRREEVRLTRKHSAGKQERSLVGKIKDATVAAADKVGDLVKSAAETVKDAVTRAPKDRKAGPAG